MHPTSAAPIPRMPRRTAVRPPTGSARRVTVLLLDGARPDVFRTLADAGDLPHLSRWVIAQGSLVPAVTAFPSTTGVAYLPLLTGCLPGTCNVPGIRWLNPVGYAGAWWRDREHVRSYCGYQAGRLNADVTVRRTLFELVPDALALCTPFDRGLTASGNRVRAARAIHGTLAHYTGRYAPLDRAVGKALVTAARERRRLVFAVFPGVDGVTHSTDPWHPRVRAMYQAFDRIVGEYAAAGGFDGDHLILVVSDHGMSRIERHTDVAVALEQRGLRTLRHPLLWRRTPHAAVMVSGNASAQVYLAPGTRRSARISVDAMEAGGIHGIPADLPAYLAALPGVAFVAGVSDGDVVLISREGRAHITPRGTHLTYRAETHDVLGLGSLPRTHDEREWLAQTIATRFPDAPLQLTQLFRSPRAGDLIVVAAEGVDLRQDWEIPEHRSGHGSLVAEHMRCLVATDHPVDGPIRTVDLFPLILDHLGIATPEGIDGFRPTRSGVVGVP